jgi:hypothetical protein
MLNRVLLFVAFCFTVFAICFLIYKNHEMTVKQQSIEKELVSSKELLGNILRSSSQYASKEDIDNLAKIYDVNVKSIQKDLDRVGGKVDAINVYVTSSKGTKKSDLPSDSSTKIDNNVPNLTVNCNGKELACPNPDVYGYLQSSQKLNLNETFDNTEVPFGSVEFSASKEKPWTKEIYARDYVSTTVIGKDENERLYSYNKTYIVVNDKKYELHIKDSAIRQEYPSPSFKFWNPRLYLGYDVGFNATSFGFATGPTLSLQLMSYGMYNRSPDFSLLQIGLGVDFEQRVVTGSLSPFLFNIGKQIPFMSNLYVGPSVQVGTNKDIMLMGGIKVGL